MGLGQEKEPVTLEAEKNSTIPSATFSPTNLKSKSNKTRKNKGTPTSARRIVKATPPKPLLPTENIIDDRKDDEKDNDKNHDMAASMGFLVLESPTVVREVQQEESEKIKRDRFEATFIRRKNAREKELEERRKNPKGKKMDSSVVKPNPMSRFLSVFSVEPQFSERKRSLELTADDDEDLKGLSGKKQKAGPDDNNDGVAADVKINNNSSYLRVGAIVLSVVAAATVMTLLYIRKRK